MSFLNYIIQIFISVVVIVLIHYLYNYFKDTYSVKKHKDVYKFNQTKYNEIFETIKQNMDSEKENQELLQFTLDESLTSNDDLVDFSKELSLEL